MKTDYPLRQIHKLNLKTMSQIRDLSNENYWMDKKYQALKMNSENNLNRRVTQIIKQTEEEKLKLDSEATRRDAAERIFGPIAKQRRMEHLHSQMEKSSNNAAEHKLKDSMLGSYSMNLPESSLNEKTHKNANDPELEEWMNNQDADFKAADKLSAGSSNIPRNKNPLQRVQHTRSRSKSISLDKSTNSKGASKSKPKKSNPAVTFGPTEGSILKAAVGATESEPRIRIRKDHQLHAIVEEEAPKKALVSHVEPRQIPNQTSVVYGSKEVRFDTLDWKAKAKAAEKDASKDSPKPNFFQSTSGKQHSRKSSSSQASRNQAKIKVKDSPSPQDPDQELLQEYLDAQQECIQLERELSTTLNRILLLQKTLKNSESSDKSALNRSIKSSDKSVNITPIVSSMLAKLPPPADNEEKERLEQEEKELLSRIEKEQKEINNKSDRIKKYSDIDSEIKRLMTENEKLKRLHQQHKS